MSSVQDIYPSRVSDKPTIAPRRDPVLWGGGEDAAPAPLTGAALRQYERDGFLFLESFFAPEEVAAFNQELERVRNDASIREAREAILEPSSGEVRSIFCVHRLSEVFGRLARDPRILGVARHFLGSQVYIHQSRINLKPGFRGEQFDWHSDFETWHVEDGMPRMRALSCSILLTENNRFNGPLMVVPGSHRKYVTCVGRTPEAHYEQSLRKQEYGVPDHESLTTLIDEGGIAAPTGPAGSVLFFDCNTMHGSPGNLSPWPRSNVFFVFNSVENALVTPFCGLAPRPEFIAARDFAPLTPAAAEAAVAR